MKTGALKVVFVSHSAAPAGAERSLVNFVSHLPSTIAPIVVFPLADGPMIDEIIAAGVPALKLEYEPYLPNVGDMEHVRKLEEKKQLEQRRFSTLFKELEVDAVVVNTNVISPAVYAAASLEIPVMLHSHGLISQRLLSRLNSQLWAFEDPAQLLSASRVICPSQIVADFYVDFYGIPRDSIEVIPNGTQFHEWKPLAESKNGPKKKFVTLCTLDLNKNVPMLIEAARIIHEYGINDVEFHVYGHGAESYIDVLRDLIWENRVDKSVFLHSKTLDVNTVYDEATAVIVTSQLESFSFVTIEAMSRGRPVISTRCGGPEYLIRDGETGFLVDRNDAASLAEKIRVLSTDQTLASRMGGAGRSVAESLYEIRALSQHYASTIEKIVHEASHESLRSKRLIAIRHTGLKRAIASPVIGLDPNSGMVQGVSAFAASDSDLSGNRVRAIEFANQYVRAQESLLGRIRTRLRARDNLWPSVSAEFQPLRLFAEKLGLPRRARLTLSLDLRRVAYREYEISVSEGSFQHVMLAVSTAAFGMAGSIGIELVSSEGKIVAHQERRLADLSPFVPVSFSLGRTRSGKDTKYLMRIFARNCEGAVWAYEFVEDRLGGLLSPRRTPFYALT